MHTKDHRNTLNIYDDKTFGAFNDKKHANKVDFIRFIQYVCPQFQCSNNDLMVVNTRFEPHNILLQKIEHRKFYRLSIFRVMI